MKHKHSLTQVKLLIFHRMKIHSLLAYTLASLLKAMNAHILQNKNHSFQLKSNSKQERRMISIFLQIELIILLWLTLSLTISGADAFPIAKHGCADSCGNVSIPYPFGIGPNCYNDSWYEIVCNKSFSPNKPFLSRLFNLEVMDISASFFPSITVGIPALSICTDSKHFISSIDLRPSPYRFSGENDFVVLDCGGSVLLRNRSKDILGGCASFCPENDNNASTRPDTDSCYGVGCCQTTIAGFNLVDFYEIGFDEEAAHDYHTCVSAGMTVRYPSKSLPRTENLLPTELSWWVVGDFANNPPSYQNSWCERMGGLYSDEAAIDDRFINGYICLACRGSYEGNPYLPNGCKVVEGCEKCPGSCDYGPNGTFQCDADNKKHHLTLGTIIGVSVGAGSIILLLFCYWLYQAVKRRKEIRQRARFFKRNGGLLLQQQMTSNEGVAEKTKIFTINELEKATDNFNENRILGRGGQGTIYKGMLMDGKIVAIKKSKKLDEDPLEQFINEMVILCQINHRNVVKLLGCCLETQVPLLVYEFIPNGTLAQHIHNPSEEFHITWKMRLQIAADSAGALTYLHSSSSSPIYHRDIKSSNILLDDKYQAKVSDFGTSRTITIDQTHLTTMVKGTFGYFDPEYFQTNQFTEKSDVYSFGVVLVELLTSKKPIFEAQPNEWRNLGFEFLLAMETSRLLDIVDKEVLREGKEEEIYAVAELAKKCLNLHGKLRPTMKEVAMVLDGVRSSQVPLEQNSPDSTSTESKLSRVSSAPPCSSTFSLEEGDVFSIDSQPLLANTL
ncbi:hypothetical protein Ancab_040289 [Ancistrocladus abbreviatus]